MAWYRRATSHYLDHCWPRYVSPHDFTRPQWITFIVLGTISSSDITDHYGAPNKRTLMMATKMFAKETSQTVKKIILIKIDSKTNSLLRPGFFLIWIYATMVRGSMKSGPWLPCSLDGPVWADNVRKNLGNQSGPIMCSTIYHWQYTQDLWKEFVLPNGGFDIATNPTSVTSQRWRRRHKMKTASNASRQDIRYQTHRNFWYLKCY